MLPCFLLCIWAQFEAASLLGTSKIFLNLLAAARLEAIWSGILVRVGSPAGVKQYMYPNSAETTQTLPAESSVNPPCGLT